MAVYYKFLTFEKTLCKLISLLNELEDKLYRNSLEVQYEYKLVNGDFNSLEEELKSKETGIYEQWHQSYKLASETYYSISILNGKMLCLIDEFIYDRSQENLDKLLWVLKCIHKEPPYALGIKVSTPDNINERLENINKFFNFMEDSEISFKFPIEVNNREKNKDSILLSEKEDFYKSILSIYAVYENSLPFPDLVLFCHSSTPLGEVNRFLNRCALNPKKIICTIVYPEKLRPEIQKDIDSKLNIFYRDKKSYSMAIITNDSKSQLVSNLIYNSLIKIVKIDSFILNDEQIPSIMNEHAPNFVVVTSKFVGLGKSEFINLEAKKKIYV